MLQIAAAMLGGALILFGLSHTLWLSLVLMVFVGFGLMQCAAVSNTIIQSLVPEDKRARVMSYYTMAFFGAAPFGSLLAGALAHRIGAPHTVIVTGAFCVAGSLWFTLELPKSERSCGRSTRKWVCCPHAKHHPLSLDQKEIMPLTKLDTIAALIVIDLQKGIAGLPSVHPIAEIVGRTAQLARAFRERGLPVVLVNVSARLRAAPMPDRAHFPFRPTGPSFVPELEQQPGDLLVTKQRWGAFLGTSLDDDLRRRGVTQIFLTGVATSAGVESTARSAYDLGYNVVLVVDAMTDLDPDAHRHSIEKIFPRLGETATMREVLALF